MSDKEINALDLVDINNKFVDLNGPGIMGYLLLEEMITWSSFGIQEWGDIWES